MRGEPQDEHRDPERPGIDAEERERVALDRVTSALAEDVGEDHPVEDVEREAREQLRDPEDPA